jgi:hypothetical protein
MSRRVTVYRARREAAAFLRRSRLVAQDTGGGYAHVSGETARYYCHVAETNATPTPLNETRRCSPSENPTVICRYGSA